MGTTWSSWLERHDAFDKRRYIDTDAQNAFYAALARVVVVIEGAIEDELDGIVEANATGNGNEERLAQLQYVLENWAREAGSIYDRVGDFPLILPVANEVQASQPEPEAVPPAADREAPPRSYDELLLKAACSNRFSSTQEVHEAIHRVVDKLPEDALPYVLCKYPRALRLFIALEINARQETATAFRLLESSLYSSEAASLVGVLAYGEDSFVKKRSRLQKMATLLRRAESDPKATGRTRVDASFNHAMTEEMIHLIDMQNRLENRLGVMHLVGSSVVETIDKLLMLFPAHPSSLSAAALVGKDFSIHPRQFWWSLVRILPQNDQWQALFMLCAAVPPPFGLVPVVEALVDAERTDLAPDLLAIVTSPDERVAIARLVAASRRATQEEEEDNTSNDA